MPDTWQVAENDVVYCRMREEQKLNCDRERLIGAARRVVIKLGTSTVTGPDGALSAARIEPIASSIAILMKNGRQVVLVSSGAVGLGAGWLGLHRSRLTDMVTKQACAAVGQSLLMNAYKNMFSASDIKIAQVLLTEDDFSDWRRYANLRQTMEKLLGFGVLPIVNENDTVSTAELETITPGRKAAFSDNDRLAALVMSGLEAELLILLSNVDGFLHHESRASAGHPSNADKVHVIPYIKEITAGLKASAAGPSGSGRGGMQTKLEAAEIAMMCGGSAVIANGHDPHALKRIFAGDQVGTFFLPANRMRGKRRWIAFAANVRGRIVVDAGAERAITQGKASLLASGVLRIESHFAPMDVINIIDGHGREFARGIANCSSNEAEKFIEDRKSRDRHGSLPKSRVLVTRDNIVLLQKS
ncbi:MAG: glutamate 5-kinase [Candidatus Acidiferrum sp.]